MDKLTAKQRCKLFGLAKEKSLSHAALRQMTPAGSVAKLTIVEAAVLIDAVQAGKSPDYGKPPRVPRNKRKRRPKGVAGIATDAQLAKIDALRIDLGWTVAGLKEWLSKRHYKTHGGTMDVIRSSDDAKEVIELLKAVIERSRKA